jgi:uncharacterized protein YjbI with pentapeptide repeats
MLLTKKLRDHSGAVLLLGCLEHIEIMLLHLPLDLGCIFQDVILIKANLSGAWGADMTTFQTVDFTEAILVDFDFASCDKLNIIMPNGTRFIGRYREE